MATGLARDILRAVRIRVEGGAEAMERVGGGTNAVGRDACYEDW